VSTAFQPRPRLLRPEPFPEIGFDEYPRITPGEYMAYSTSAKIYRDPAFRRWVCRVKWNVVQSSSCLEPIACGICMFMGLGERDQPHVGRRSNYLTEWIRANGGAPSRSDRLAPQIFTRRLAQVRIADAKSAVPYSVVRTILNWETGTSFNQVINQSHNQVRQEISDCRKN